MSSSSSSSSSSDDESKSALNPGPSPPESSDKPKASTDNENENEEPSKKEEKKSTANNNASKKKRKRRQRSKSEDERELIEAQKERYDRLIFTARKQLHKTAKQIRTFLLQKEIRKQSGKENASSGIDAKKSLDLDVVTSQALRQLGLYHCDPRFKISREETTPEDGPTETEDSNAANNPKDEKSNKRKKGN